MTATTKLKRVPDLRFPEFTEEWEEKSIGQITDRYVNPVKVEVNTFYQEIGIRSHGKGIFHKELIKGEDLGNKRVFWIKENAFIVNIVFPWEQAVAKTTKNEIGLIASHRFPMYIPKYNQCSIDYLLHFFLTKKGKTLLELASPGGAGRNKTLGQKEFEKTSFYISNLAEQQKIADFLSSLDERIRLLKEKKANLETYKRGIMEQIFSQTLRFRNKDGNNYPDWEEKTLGEITKYYDGTHQTPNYVEKGIPFYSVEQVTANNFSETKFISESVFEKENERVKIEKGDILMTRIGDIGTVKYIDWDVNASFYVSLALIKQNNKLFNSKYISHFINSQFFQQELWKRTIHVAFPKKINLGEIGECKVQLPCFSEQQQIADFLSAIDDKITLCSTQIAAAEEYKKGLLQQMFV